MAAIQTIEYSTDHTWGTPGSGTWTDLGDFLTDGLEPGTEEAVSVEMGDGANEQDGVRCTGSFAVKDPDSLAAGTRTWFRFKDDNGAGHRVGGTDGCRITLGKVGTRPLGGGPHHTRVDFTATGSEAGDTISTTLS